MGCKPCQARRQARLKKLEAEKKKRLKQAAEATKSSDNKFVQYVKENKDLFLWDPTL